MAGSRRTGSYSTSTASAEVFVTTIPRYTVSTASTTSTIRTGEMAKKGRVYGRGMGHVLRVHHYGVFRLLYWASRPLATAFISAFSGRVHRAVYSLSVSVGRIEGWTGHVWDYGNIAGRRSS